MEKLVVLCLHEMEQLLLWLPQLVSSYMLSSMLKTMTMSESHLVTVSDSSLALDCSSTLAAILIISFSLRTDDALCCEPPHPCQPYNLFFNFERFVRLGTES